jgi:hypothetical protein
VDIDRTRDSGKYDQVYLLIWPNSRASRPIDNEQNPSHLHITSSRCRNDQSREELQHLSGIAQSHLQTPGRTLCTNPATSTTRFAKLARDIHHHKPTFARPSLRRAELQSKATSSITGPQVIPNRVHELCQTSQKRANCTSIVWITRMLVHIAPTLP